MTLSPVQIKEKLLKGLDEENNVTDSSVVWEVIGLLEKARVTREDLESTRLGKYVNDLRKKTSDPSLAKRCKNIVKSWQQLVSSTPSNNASPVSNCSPALARSTGYSPQNLSAPQSVSPASSRGGWNGSRTVSPAIAQHRHQGRLVSPLVTSESKKGTRTKLIVQTSPKNITQVHHSSTKSTSGSHSAYGFKNLVNGGRPLTPIVKPHTPSANRPYTPTTSKPHTQIPATSSSRHLTHAANHDTGHPASPHLASQQTDISSSKSIKKRRRSDESIASDASSLKRARLNNGVVTERSKTPKVKTTVQLIADLQAQKSGSIAASDTITKIVTNQIVKEKDDIHASVVPPSARPRARRKPGSGAPVPPGADGTTDLSQTKNDLVQRFLQQTADASQSPEIAERSGPSNESMDVVVIDEPDIVHKPTIDLSIDPYSLLPPIDYNSISWSDSDEDDPPPLRNPITGELPEGYSEPTRAADIDSKLDIAMTENWNGVNGTGDDQSFHDWTKTFTVNSSTGVKDSVYILPYVDIDQI